MSWDDGKHTKVKKVQITYGNVINSIEFEYDSNGKTYKSQKRGGGGGKPDGFTLNSDEYITDVNGYYTTMPNGDDVITALTFKTNQRTLGPYGNKTRNYFSINSPKDNQVVGFHGLSSDVLNSIDVHFGPIVPTGTGSGTGSGTESGAGTGSGTGTGTGSGPETGGAQKVEAQGGKGGKEWDDGANHDGVRKILVGVGRNGIHNIKFDYDKSGQLKDSPLHGSTKGASSPTPFEIEHPDEYLVSVVGHHENGIIQALQFKTNKKESQVFGYPEGTKFTLEVKDKKIVGFHGFAELTLNSLGAYFVPVSSSSSGKVEAQGGKGGKEWDDGADHDGVRKIVVGVGRKGVHYVKFDYDKGGQLKDAPAHGSKNGTFSPLSTFEIDHPSEYLVSVVGYYNNDTIQGLQFKTNKKESEVFGYDDVSSKFTLEVKDKKIVGFHGFAETYLNSLGAYFATTSSTPPSSVNKLDAQGGKGEATFDDGAFDGLRKVYVGQGDSGVVYVQFEYEKDGKLESRAHGRKGKLAPEPFELEEGEYITSVEGYYETIYPFKEPLISALIFKTSKGRTSPQFGMESTEKFELDGKGGKLVGFHGSYGEVLHSLGAYFAPSTTPLTPANK